MGSGSGLLPALPSAIVGSSSGDLVGFGGIGGSDFVGGRFAGAFWSIHAAALAAAFADSTAAIAA